MLIEYNGLRMLFSSMYDFSPRGACNVLPLKTNDIRERYITVTLKSVANLRFCKHL